MGIDIRHPVSAALAGLAKLAQRRHWSYQPLLVVSIAFAAGVICESQNPNWWPEGLVLPVSLAGWLLSSLLTWRCQPACLQWLSTAWFLVICFSFGATRYDQHWNRFASDDISYLVRQQIPSGNRADPPRTTACILRGRLVSDPVQIPPRRDDPRSDWRTQCRIQVTGWFDNQRWRRASGRTMMFIDGKAASMRSGDQIQIGGILSRPRPPSNPGEFDYERHLRGQRILSVLYCNADNISLLKLARSNDPGSLLQRASGSCTRMLQESLAPDRAALAAALLLGQTKLLTDELRGHFIGTGTMHLLAISGLHLGLLVSMVWVILRCLGLSHRSAAAVVAGVAISYCLFTGARPPILRAAILICCMVGSTILQVRSRKANVLALAALLILLLQPSDLFSAGFQLSFLAVGTLFWVLPVLIGRLRPVPDAFEQLVHSGRHPFVNWVRRLGLRLVELLCVNFTVWLVTAPLVATQFHVWTPIAAPMTILLLPLVCCVLVVGPVYLIAGHLFADPWLAGLLDWFLELILTATRAASGSFLGVQHTSGLGDWWLIGFYLTLLLWLFLQRGWLQKFSLVLMATWLCAGLLIRPGRHDQALECHLLSVGNGSAAILRLPGGRGYLIDAGQISNPNVGKQIVAPALWSLGIRRLDRIFISHADLDHFNGVADVLERFDTGRIVVPLHFLTSDQPEVARLRSLIARRGIPLDAVWKGASFQPTGNVKLEILHPPMVYSGSDNEQSLVIKVSFENTSLLLPGDVEGSGLSRLMAGPGFDCDVLVSPHHGSPAANPEQLIDWCQPEIVVVSRGRARSANPALPYAKRGIGVLTTRDHGAVRVRFRAGSLELDTFR